MSEINPDTGSLYRLHDVVADRYAPVVEYPNDKVAVNSCRQLKLPPYLEEGDFALVCIGFRKGLRLIPCDPVVVWQYAVEEPNGPV